MPKFSTFFDFSSVISRYYYLVFRVIEYPPSLSAWQIQKQSATGAKPSPPFHQTAATSAHTMRKAVRLYTRHLHSCIMAVPAWAEWLVHVYQPPFLQFPFHPCLIVLHSPTQTHTYASSVATSTVPANLANSADVTAYLSESGPTSHKGTDIVVPTGQGANLVVVDIAPGGQSQMHRTVSIDFSICVIGHVRMELDGGEMLDLRPGVSMLFLPSRQEMWRQNGRYTNQY